MPDPLRWGYATSVRRIDQRIYRLATVVEAAEITGIAPDAVRSRPRQGPLRRSPPRRRLGEKAPNPCAKWLSHIGLRSFLTVPQSLLAGADFYALLSGGLRLRDGMASW